jgi:hypothetical protein
MKRSRFACLLLGTVWMLTSCDPFPNVIQGRVESCDTSAQTLLLRDETQPDRTLEFSLRGAEIGANPVVGDTLRIAYREKDGRNVATRVMNVTRQKELRRQGGKNPAGGH